MLRQTYLRFDDNCVISVQSGSRLDLIVASPGGTPRARIMAASGILNGRMRTAAESGALCKVLSDGWDHQGLASDDHIVCLTETAL